MKSRVTQPNSFAVSVGIGLLSAIVISIIGTIIATYMFINQTADVTSMKLFASIIQFISVAIGGAIACGLTKGKYALTAGAAALAYAFILVSIAVLFFDSTFSGFWTGMLSVALGCAVSCIICIMRMGKKKIRKRVHS